MEIRNRRLARAASLVLGALVPVALAQTPSPTAGNCLAFDGVDDFVGVARSVALEPGEITIELWARLDGPQDWNTRLLRKGEHDAYFMTCDQDLDQQIQVMYTRGSQFRVWAKDPQKHTAYLGEWHHFLGIYALDHLEFWIDGVQVASEPHSLGAMTHLPLTDLCIGAGLPVQMPNEYFKGRIDEVRLWNYPRTPAEIAASWNRTVGGGEPGLIARWNFDEGAGQAAHDLSSFGHHGVLGATNGVGPDDPTWVPSDAPILPLGCDVTSYCIGAINSTGKGAAIGWSGTTSVGANDLVLEVQGCPPTKPGLFFFGVFQTQIPFGEGYLCVTGSQKRLPIVKTDASGAASFALDFTDPSSPASLITAGSQWNFQFWYRDPQPVGHGFNFSNALIASFCP